MKKILSIALVAALSLITNVAHALEDTYVKDSLNALTISARNGLEFEENLSNAELALTTLANQATADNEAGKLLKVGLESLEESAALYKLRAEMGEPSAEALHQANMQQYLINKFTK